MDTNLKTLQVNTFLKGMNTDTSDALLSNDLYRMARNLRVVTNTEENSGELRLIEGLNQNNLPSIPDGEILAATSIRDYGILVVRNDPQHTPLLPIEPDDPGEDPEEFEPKNFNVKFLCIYAKKTIDEVLGGFMWEHLFKCDFYTTVNNASVLSNTREPIRISVEIEYVDNSIDMPVYDYTWHLSTFTFQYNSNKPINKINSVVVLSNSLTQNHDDYNTSREGSTPIWVNTDTGETSTSAQTGYVLYIAMTASGVISYYPEINETVPGDPYSDSRYNWPAADEDSYTIGYRLVKYSDIPGAGTEYGNPLLIEPENAHVYQIEYGLLKYQPWLCGNTLTTLVNTVPEQLHILGNHVTIEGHDYQILSVKIEEGVPVNQGNPAYFSLGIPTTSDKNIDTISFGDCGLLNTDSTFHTRTQTILPNPNADQSVSPKDVTYFYSEKSQKKYYFKQFKQISLSNKYPPRSAYEESSSSSTGSHLAPRRIRLRTNEQDSDKGWSIYVFNNKDNTLTECLQCLTPIGNDYINRLSLVTTYENNLNLKLYIADGEHLIICVNVLKYNGSVNINDILNYSGYFLKPITSITKTAGLLKPALVAYSYRLYDRGGISSQMSPVSQFNVVTKGSDGVLFGLNSSTGYDITIPNNPGIKYTYIQIYRITFQQVGQNPTIELIIDLPYKSGFQYTDNGQPSLENLTLEEFESFGGIDFIPRMIESKDGYLFAANIKYSSSEYVDSFDAWKADAMTEDMLDNLSFDAKYDFNSWKNGDKIGCSGDNISWELIVDQQIIDYRLNNVGISSWSSYPQYKTLRRDEIYRYGIVLYGNDGYKSPVKWIADIRIPSSFCDNYVPAFERFIYPFDSSLLLYILYANNIGVKFTVNNLPEGCVAYEIVRCNRSMVDRHNVTQVALSPVLEKQDSTDNKVCASGLIHIGRIYYTFLHSATDPNIHIVSKYDTLLAFSPEISYQSDDVKQIMQSFNTKLIPLYLLAGVGTLSENSVGPYRRVTFGIRSSLGYEWLDNSEDPRRISVTAMPIDPNATYRSLCPDNKASKDYINRYSYNKFYTASREFKDSKNGNYKTLSASYDIDDFAFPLTRMWNEFAPNSKDLELTYVDHTTIIHSNEFLEWAFPLALAFNQGEIKEFLNNVNNVGEEDENDIEIDTRIDAAGKCMLIYVDNRQGDNDDLDSLVNYDYNSYSGNYAKTLIANITKDATPYGGLNGKSTCKYYSHGLFHLIADNDPTTSTIDVYDGDTFIRCFECTATHQWDSAIYQKHLGETTVYSIPVETDIDTTLDSGFTFAECLDSTRYAMILDRPTAIGNYFVQNKPEYEYNTGYSIDPNMSASYSIKEYDRKIQNSFDYRIHYSNPKSNNEYVDSWTMFQPLNYIDVDTRFGQLTDLRTFKNQLIYWQNSAIGLLSVNERTLITDSSNLPLILGTGGVLSRYDYISTTNGMRSNEFADTQSDYALYWWDHDHAELCMYNSRSGAVSLSKTKNLQNLLNDRSKNNMLFSNNSLQVLLFYDKKYNEVLFTVSYDNTINSEETIVYNEQVGAFTSIYQILPISYLSFDNRLILTTQKDLWQWNTPTNNGSQGLANGLQLLPYLKYIINQNATYTKVFDTSEFGGRFYGGGSSESSTSTKASTLSNVVQFAFNTPLKQRGEIDGNKITNRQYDFRFDIPRAGKIINQQWVTEPYGDRLRGKTMQCEMSSLSNSLDFSLQYITTKYRISWS